jgi:FHA domain-containing protein
MDESTHLLELLDPEQHHAVQAWPLDAGQEVTVGRARTNVIVLASPLVSRQHARLRFLESCWVVEALSELGVWWRGGMRSRLALEAGTVWSLGEHGPRLRLVRAEPHAFFDAEATIRARPETLGLGLPTLDAARRDREVAEITGSDFFRQLEQRAGRLRARARGEE